MNNAQPFLIGHAESANWSDAVDACLQQLGDIPRQSNFGFLYATDSFTDELPSILGRLREATGVAHWSGTVGIGICATGREYHEAPAIAVMICSFPTDSFRILPFYDRAADHIPEAWDPWLQQSNTHLAVVHADPSNSNLPQLLAQLDDELPGAFLVGGISSSHGRHPQIADEVQEGGLSGVVFNDKVPAATALSQGCTPIAVKRTITDCDNNIINRIDNQPALDILKQDIGEILARDINRAAGYIFAGLPIEQSDTGDYLVRNLIGIDSEGKRIAIGDITYTGQQIQFCRRDSKTARDDMQRMLDELRGRTTATPRGGLYYSCLGRGESLFGENSAELKLIRDTFGEFPLVGFFANGEISNQRLYGYTGVLTLFM